MPNFTISEILTILLVILIVFGPQRLPEMAQKAGQLVRRARNIIGDLRQEFEGEWQEVAQPLRDVRTEVMGVKDDLDSSMRGVSDDIARAKRELEAEMEGAREEIDEPIAETERSRDEVTPDEGSAEDPE